MTQHTFTQKEIVITLIIGLFLGISAGLQVPVAHAEDSQDKIIEQKNKNIQACEKKHGVPVMGFGWSVQCINKTATITLDK